MRAYQSSRLPIPANPRIASRYAARRGRADRPPRLRVEAAVAARDGEARDEPLDVPLERARQRLVEVVDAEDEAPIRRGERAEVGQVGVAAELDLAARARRVGQVRGHLRRGPAEEGERRHQHPPVAERHELRDPGGGLLVEQLDRIGAVRRRLPFGVRGARHEGPNRLARRRSARRAWRTAPARTWLAVRSAARLSRGSRAGRGAR